MSAPDFPNQAATGNDLDSSVRDDASKLAETARHDIEDVTQQVKHEAAALGDEVKQQAAALGEEAKAQLAEVAEKAKGMATEQKDLFVDQLSGVSTALNRVAEELETNGEGTAHYARMIADGADKLTATVRYNNVDDIMHMAEDFGRKQPVAFMGAAALLGFVASRFLLASASRRAEQGQGQSSYQPPAAPSSYAAGTMSSNRPSYDQTVGGSDAGI